MLNAILKTFRGQLDPSRFFPLRFFGGVFMVLAFCDVFCSSFSCVSNIASFVFIVPLVFSNVYSTIVNGVAEERYFRVSSVTVPGEGYSRNA